MDQPIDLTALRNLPHAAQQMSDDELESALQELALLMLKIGIVTDIERHTLQAAIQASDPPEITPAMLVEGAMSKAQAKVVMEGYAAVWREAKRRAYAQTDMSQD